jgi:hypothetical protein
MQQLNEILKPILACPKIVCPNCGCIIIKSDILPQPQICFQCREKEHLDEDR